MWGAISNILGLLTNKGQSQQPQVEQKAATNVDANFSRSNYGDLIKEMLLQSKTGM